MKIFHKGKDISTLVKKNNMEWQPYAGGQKTCI